MYKLINFLKKFLIKDTLYCINYLFFIGQKNYKEKITFLTDDAFLRQSDTKSTIRFGDGEIGIIHYSKVHYQDFDEKLREKMIEMIQNYTKDSSYILGVPLHATLENKLAPTFGENKIFLWMPTKITFRLLFNKNLPYFDAHFFYRDGKARSFFLEKIKNKKVIIVTKKDTVNKMQESFLVSNSLQATYIISPSENTFSVYENICNQIKSIIKEDYGAFVTFLACGPASKVIAYELAKDHIICHDIGFGIEIMLTNESYEHRIN